MHPAVKAVLSELIQGKLKRPAHRPVSAETELRDMRRALLVLDKEGGGVQRKAAVSRTAEELKCGIRTIEKALAGRKKPGARGTELPRLRWSDCNLDQLNSW